MKVRVKQKVSKKCNVALTEADEQILRMFGNEWLDNSLENQELYTDESQGQVSSESANIACDEDLRTYLENPYEIEELHADNVQGVSQSSDGFGSQGPSSSGTIARGRLLRGRLSRGKSSRGLATRAFGRSSRGHPQRGTTFGYETKVNHFSCVHANGLYSIDLFRLMKSRSTD